MKLKKHNEDIIKKGIFGAVALGLIAAVGVYASQNKRRGDSEVKVQPITSSVKYRDGTYQALGSYQSPAGEDTLDVSLTIVNNIVTVGSITGHATHPASKKWQAEFQKGFDQAVVGKNINELSLTVVNGSSLTPKGFMDALDIIKNTAKI